MKINTYRTRYIKISDMERISFKVPIYCCNCYGLVSYNTVLSDLMIPYKQYSANTIRNYISGTFRLNDCICSNSSIYNWKVWFKNNKYKFLDTYILMLRKPEYCQYYFSSSYIKNLEIGTPLSKTCYLFSLFKAIGYR
jgi:hypothetical protein